MQLNNNKLALAAAGLLSAAQAVTVSASEWSNEVSALYYGEGDHRVKDGSVKYKGVRTGDGGNILSFNLGVDTLTGASPSGVAPSATVQTITSPSGNTSSVAAYAFPLDDNFKDTRVSGGINWDQSILNDKTRGIAGVSFSKEYDYLHLGISGGLSREINNKNTVFSVGLAYSGDTVKPVGGLPTVLSSSDVRIASSKSKNTTDAVIGVTQILSKDAILQLNYGLSKADGYLNDPYKWISRVDNSGVIIENLHESRPSSRISQSVYAAIKYNIYADNVLSSSARLYSDDWGIKSITLDTRYKFDLGNQKSIEPHLRLYHQTAADFYRPSLNAAYILPKYASADYRLTEFDAYTVGSTYRWKSGNNKEWRVTGEYYSQKPTDASQQSLDALMVSLGVKF